MIINKRMMKRNGAAILTICVFASLTLLHYYTQTGNDNTDDKLRDTANNADVITEQRKELQKPAVELSKMRDKQRDKEAIVPDGKLLHHNLLETDKNCKLDPRVQLFAEKDDGYDMIRLSKSEIYADKFTHSKFRVKPVFPSLIIRLDPDRFLLPILMRGPNNQLIGLRESIYVAMRLNRTLVIPLFVKHRTDSQLHEGTTVHPAHRVAFEELCKFVSCITLQQFRKACGNQADVIFRLRHYSRNRINTMESLTGMRFSDSGEKGTLNLLPSIKDKSVVNFPPDKEHIVKLFASEERCGIYAQPFYNLKIRVKPSKRLFRPGADLQSYTNGELFSEIIRRTPAPSYVRDISDEFVKATFGGAKFITAHWRYDKKDWMKRCKKLDEDSDRKQRCNEASLIEPKNVANAVLKKIQDIKPGISGITHIYIAAPPSELDFIKAVKKILNAEKYAVFCLKDLIKFFHKKHASCKFLREHEGDIASTVEMQICAKGTVFLKSSRSSWSGNVIEWRRHNSIPGTHTDKDEDIFQLAKIAREQI